MKRANWALTFFTGLAALLTCGAPAGSAAKKPDAAPAYCDPNVFRSREETSAAAGIAGLRRAHAYRLGKVLLVGLAVGDSDPIAVQELARRHSSAAAAEGFCTWYVNKGNPEAAKRFMSRPLPNPSLEERGERLETYLAVLGPSFLDTAQSFSSCAAEHGYIALGCDWMMHRGPTVFGMLLAFSGCSPENALQIANETWGMNDIPADTRLAFIRAAHEFGLRHRPERDRLRELLSR